MARKLSKVKNKKSHQSYRGEDIDATQPGIVHIDDEPYFVDGIVAKFILELLDEVDLYKEQIKELEKYTGEYGKS